MGRYLIIIFTLLWPVQGFGGVYEQAVEDFLARKYQKAASGFEQALDEGDVRGNSYLGRMYLIGTYFDQDAEYGRALMSFAADDDLTGESSYWYAQALLGGWGNQEPNKEFAFYMFEDAVKLKYPPAYNNLGRIYLEGHGAIKKDPQKAREVFEAGVKLGDHRSRLSLANLLSEDKDLPVEPALAISLYQDHMEAERAAGRTDTLWVSEERIKLMNERIEKDKVRHASVAKFPYEGTLPHCKKSDEIWHNCYGSRAIERDDAGSRYEGEWRNNRHHGKGAIISALGWIYRGDFVDGQQLGQAEYTWPDGWRYVGAWKGFRMHGFGRLYDPNGRLEYEGEYKEGKRWSAAEQKKAKEREVQAMCERELRRKYEFTQTDKYGNRTQQRFEVIRYGYLLEGEQSRYRGYGGHPTLVYSLVMFNNGWMVKGKPLGYCVIRSGTYLKSNQLIDVEVKTNGR